MSLLVALALSVVATPQTAEAFSLEEAVAGIDGEGGLHARVETSSGTLDIALFESKAPATVANFVALARGLRPFKDGRTGEWVKRPFYDGLGFHRRIPGFVVQGGCPRGDGRGGPGYFIRGEFDDELRHEQPGVVSMANDGPDRNGSQFFITEGPQPHLDRKHPIFGQVVSGLAIVHAIARAQSPVTIEHIRFFRRADPEQER